MASVTLERPVQFAIGTLHDEEKQGVLDWLRRLKDWDSDAVLRKQAQQLDTLNDTYVLKASDDFRIFFRLREGHITVLDIAKKSTIVSSGMNSE